jgi:signal transduction histidine kinase
MTTAAPLRCSVDAVTDRRRTVAAHGATAAVAALAVAALVENLVSPTVTVDGVVYDRGPDALLAAVLTAAVVLVVLRRRLGVLAPLGAVVLFGLASFAAPVWLIDSSALFVLVMVLCGLTGYLVDDRFGRLGLPVLWLVGLVAALQYPRPSWSMGIAVLAFITVAWAVGLLIRYPVARARSAEEHAVRVEQEQAEAARQAVLEERRRIARELHDVVAHSVSVMTVQAGAVRRVLREDQDREREALLAVERTGRDAMAEMRRVVGLLREEGEAAPLSPQPGLETLSALLGTVRDAGLDVDLVVEGERRALPPGLDLAAFRVVQEALTNALRHARPTRASVMLQFAPDTLRIEVANDGAGGGPIGRGHGSTGMRERVALYGGTVESGPREGGYLVAATLPIGGAS